eukprot:5138781-Alexandrium_andersonii.AAC.1
MATLLRTLGSVPRALADNISVTTKGEGHWQALKASGVEALKYLTAAGARIAHQKSACLSTSQLVRGFMRQHVWPVVNARIQTVNDMRDLGAHMAYTVRMVAGTLAVRASKVVSISPRLRLLPASLERKLQ